MQRMLEVKPLLQLLWLLLQGKFNMFFPTCSSMVPVKAPKMGFPPFSLDPEKLMMNVDLSGRRKLFYLHVTDDLVVPTFNHYLCVNATKTSIANNNYTSDRVESYLGEIIYPYTLTNRSRTYCNNHLAFMFNSMSSFHSLLSNFFLNNL